MLESFTLSTFSDRLGQTFRVCPPSSDPLEIELINATDLGPKPKAPQGTPVKRQSSFSLLFRGPMEPILPQKMYPFEHPELGKFDLFIVPVGPDQAGQVYEAVFN